MPILEKAKPICFYESVGITLPQPLDMWASFDQPFIVVSVRPELTKKGEELLGALAFDMTSSKAKKRKELIEKYPTENADTICVVQWIPKGLTFFEAQMFTKAQVKAMLDPKARRLEMRYNDCDKKSHRRKGDFGHCLLWWRD